MACDDSAAPRCSRWAHAGRPQPREAHLSSREQVSLVALAHSYSRLLMNDAGRVDTQSEKGASACGKFLKTLERAAHVLDLEPAPRTYREQFTVNYRALFDCETRDYRVDILEAGTTLSQHPVIWANGESYELSSVAMRCSEKLLEAWADVCSLMDTWVSSPSLADIPVAADLNSLIRKLDNLDIAWACFECAYISELMKVQERARCLVAEAAESERRLSLLEQSFPAEELAEMPAYQAEKRALVACIARLNSVANSQRKGRDDLAVGILDAAVDLLRSSSCSSGGAQATGRVLAEQVVESFEDLRDYLHEVQHHLDLLHPHLCQNPGLVSRLVRWEETWEIGARYIHSPEVLSALCHVVPHLQRACRIAPELVEMIENCDAELFLVLPRIVWLCLLADPAKPSELVRRLLPHRFTLRACAPATPAAPRSMVRRHSDPDLLASADQPRAERSPWMGPELQGLTERYWRAELLLARARAADGPTAWDVLIRRAVAGAPSAGHSDPYGGLPGRQAGAGAAAAEELMHELEAWSMELQRHSAEDWNECINVLVQCLMGRQCKAPRAEFSV